MDVLHIFDSMCPKTGIGPEELYRASIRKYQENFARQEGRTGREGYAWNK